MKSTTKKFFDLAARIDYGIRKGAAKAYLEHKMANRSIYVLKDGKVVEIPADQIVVPEVLPPKDL